MKVSEIMITELRSISIDKDRMISDALNIMDKQNISVLLVTKNKGFLAGIVTERAIADRLGSSRAGKLKASSLHISSVMENVKNLNPDDDVETAADIMSKEKLSGLPIVENDELIGLVTYNELTKLCEKVKTYSVEKIMSKNPIFISPDDRLVHARNTIFEKKISVLPCILESKVRGIISEGMIARAFAEFRETVPAKHQEERLRYILVGDVMKIPTTISITANEEIGNAANLMLTEGMRGIPIVDDNDIFIGIVTKTDMINLVKNQFQVK